MTEGRVRRWGRRAISVPLYFALALATCIGAPLWLLATLLLDLGSRRGRRLPRVRAWLFLSCYLCCETAGIVLAALLWTVTAGGRLGGAPRYLAANAALQRWWTSTLYAAAKRVFSLRIEVAGAECAEAGPFLLFVRHSSTADTLLAAALLANPHRLTLRYVLKRELLWDPCLDIIGQRLPNVFVDRDAARRAVEVQAIADLARGLGRTSAVLIYPEGTRFSEAKRDRAVRALGAKGSERLAGIARTYRSVLPPRIAGPIALLEAAPHLDVVLLEHHGFEGAATFARFFGGELIGATIRARVRRIAAASIPTADRASWLFETWAETDRWVSSWAAG